MVSCHFTKSHKSISVAEFFCSSDDLSYFHMACSLLLLGNLAGGQKCRSLFPPLLLVNFPTAQFICFTSGLHSLLMPLSSWIYLHSHPGSLMLLRDSNLLLLWYFAGFISICSIPFITFFSCNPHTYISLVFSMVQTKIFCHTFSIQMHDFQIWNICMYKLIFIF